MRKTWKSSVLLIGTAMLGAVALSGTNAMAAGEITEIPATAVLTQSVIESLAAAAPKVDFGSIDINPAGDVITMDCKATVGNPGGTALVAAVVTKGSVVTGAECAELVITAANNLTVQVDYIGGGASLNLVDSVDPVGNTTVLVLSDVDANSGANAAIPLPVVGGSPGTIYVGGKLTVPPGAETATYIGDYPITVNYL